MEDVEAMETEKGIAIGVSLESRVAVAPSALSMILRAFVSFTYPNRNPIAKILTIMKLQITDPSVGHVSDQKLLGRGVGREDGVLGEAVEEGLEDVKGVDEHVLDGQLKHELSLPPD